MSDPPPLGIPLPDFLSRGIPLPDFLSRSIPPRDQVGIRWQVTVTAPTRHGPTKVRTYAVVDGRWVDMLVGTRRQIADARRGNHAWVHRRRDDAPGEPWLDADPAARIHLAKGVDVPAATLGVILNALYAEQRPKVALEDIKLVISQLGSSIARLSELDGAQRVSAELALYTQILDRCSMI